MMRRPDEIAACHGRLARPCILTVIVLAATSAAHAGQAPPDYGLDWVTIGDPGNRGTLPEEAPGLPPGQSIGSVPYKYRMTRTEITAGQWFEFVQAYAPYYDGPGVNTAFTGQHIGFIAGSFVLTGPRDAPTRMSWEYAARYANWLCSGRKPNAPQSDFESGAYDTSTFTQNPDGTWNHQAERSPGALLWIPNLDEWTKASHWSPADERYWYRQGSQDEPLVSGNPADGGETNAGLPLVSWELVGGYPNVASPWGLLDTSGGVFEWTETVLFGNPVLRAFRGSARGFGSHQLYDSIDTVPETFVQTPLAGVRLASAIPSPSAMVALGLFGLCSLHRRR